MKHFTLSILLFLCFCCISAQTILTAGDLAFVSTNSDGPTYDQDTFAFVLLKDIDAATQIHFTDRGWNDVTGFYDVLGDSQFTWTSGVDRSVGDVVVIDGTYLFPASYSTIGDQIFAYQGLSDVTPVFIAGLQTNVNGASTDANWDGAATDNATSALPDQLQNGVNAMRFITEYDNGQFSTIKAGGSTFSSAKEIRLAVNNINNWDFSDSNSFLTPVDTPDFQFSVERPFITTWETTTAGETITIPTNGTGYNFDIDWGDGTVQTNQTGTPSHSYVTPGIHTVKITGAFPQIYFYFSPDASKIRTVEQWGDIQWRSMQNAFHGCSQLRIPATDAPDLSQVTNMNQMFSYASSFNDNINHWDVSNVTNMMSLFFGANSFNQDLNSWNVSNVTTMSQMFFDAKAFNGDVSSWNVSNVETMSSMFVNATSFNQNIGNWDVSNVQSMAYMFQGATSFNQNIGNWDVSNVQSMAYMFQGATSFNQNIGNWDVGGVMGMPYMFNGAVSFNQDLSRWNVSNVRDMVRMFQGAINFDQDLGEWDISSLSQDMFVGGGVVNMFTGAGLSTKNYDSTLIGWSTLNVAAGEARIPTSLTFDAGHSTYCTASAERLKLINEYNWTVTDGGNFCPCLAPEEPVLTLTNNNICPGSATTINISGNLNSATEWVIYSTSCGGTKVGSTTGNTFEVNPPNGNTTYYVRGEDGAGCVDETIGVCASITVTVEDNEAPTITCPNDIEVNTDEGVCGTIVNYSVTGTDNCGTEGPLVAATPGLVLDIGTMGGVGVRTSLAYNPVANKYYAVFGGTSSNPLDCFDGTTGALISSSVPSFDYRGVWWNPALGQAEGNGYNTAGVVSMSLAGDCPIDGVISELAANQPNRQSCGDLDTDANEIIYYFSGVITRVDRVTGATSSNVAISGQPGGSSYNANTIGYTGVAGYEYMLYDLTTLSAHLFDLTGVYTGASVIGLTPQLTGYAVAYENNLAWIYAANQWSSFEIFGASNSTITQTEGLPSGSDFPVGTTTNTFVVTDSSGNTASCSFDVIVNDNEAPVLIAEAAQDVVLDADCSITVPNLVDGSSATDNCIVTITQFPVAGTVVESSHNGTVEVVVTATDAADNKVESTVVLTAKDNEAPVLAAEADQDVVLDADCSITVPNLVDGSSATDNCMATITQSPIAGTIVESSHNGTVEVVVTATDAADNKVESTVVLTAKDNEAPVLAAEADQDIILDADCSITIPNLVDGSSATDNCMATITQSPVAGTIVESSHNGTVEVIVTATDAADNKVESTVVLTAKDNEAPVLAAEAAQDVVLDADCSITVPNLVDGSSATDNCIVTITQFPVAGTVVESSHNGTVEVVVTATDAADNKVESTVVLTAKDNEAPVLAAEADQDVVLDADCSITVPNLVDGSSATDNCMATITQSPIAGTIVESSHNGTVEVVVTATDAADNKVESTVVLTAKDNEAPVLAAEADQDIILDADCSITIPNLVDGSSATDNCMATITQSPVAGTIVESSHNGTVEVIVTATDAADNKVESTVVLTAKDNEAPVLAAEAAQDVVLDADCSITVPNLVDGSSATDNCIVTITQFPVAGTVVESSHNGTVEVVVTATDAADNKVESTVVLTAKDNEAPVLAAEAAQDVVLDADCSITVPNLVDGSSATDNCIVTITQFPVAGTVVESSHNGTVEVVVTATDAADNKVESTVVLTAKDNEAPVLAAEADQDVVLDADCSITVPNLVDGSSATDNCMATITQSPIAGTIVESSHNGTVEVVVTATDAADNKVESTVVLTAKDNEAPVLAAEADQDIILDADCSITVPNLVDGSSATDNCMATITQSPVAGTIVESSHNGTVEVVVTATDAADNKVESTVVLTAKDFTAPIAVADLLDDITAICEVLESDVTPPTATDNCVGAVSVSHDANFPITTQGLTVITWSFEDVNGNIAMQTQNVNIEDLTAPVPDVDSLDDIIVECEATNIAAPNATDNCAGTITGTTLDPTSYSEEGEYMILWEFHDGNGNVATQEQWVTVQDQTAPEVSAQDLTVSVTQDEPAVITPEEVNDGSTDNCGDIVFTLDRDTFDKPGVYEVVLTATDASGNTSQAKAKITVKREGADPKDAHVVPTMLTRTSIAKVILPFNGRISEVHVMETETNNYRVFEGNKKNTMQIDIAPMKGTLLVKIIDAEGNVYMKKLIAL